MNMTNSKQEEVPEELVSFETDIIPILKSEIEVSTDDVMQNI